MSLSVLNHRPLRDGLRSFLADALDRLDHVKQPKFADAAIYIVTLTDMTIHRNGPHGSEDRHKAKRDAWSAVVRGLGMDVDVPDEVSLNILTLASREILLPVIQGCELESDLAVALLSMLVDSQVPSVAWNGSAGES
jgi:hypothetical protein